MKQQHPPYQATDRALSMPTIKPGPSLGSTAPLYSVPHALSDAQPETFRHLRPEHGEAAPVTTNMDQSASVSPTPYAVLKPKTEQSSRDDTPWLGNEPATEANKPSQCNLRLQQVLASGSPELLEAAVKIGVDLLNTLRATLTLENGEIKAWIKSIDELQDRAKPTKTIIGVVGNTGAGKSSIINALLDEERLLPTNCMRAVSIFRCYSLPFLACF